VNIVGTVDAPGKVETAGAARHDALVKFIAYAVGLALSGSYSASHAGSASYTYDALGRVTNVTNSNSVNVGYQYDSLGNFISRVIASPPSAPPTVTGSSIGNGSVTFTFTSPSNYTGAAITGYVAACTPGSLSASVSANATSVTVSGLVRGTTYTCTIAPNSAAGFGPSSLAQNIVGGSQTITFASVKVLWMAINTVIPVTASSGLPVSLASTTPSICSVVGGTTVRGLAAGSCALNATQAGDANFLAATPVSAILQVISPAILFTIFGDD
jgi:YD repeat-containing protein